MRACVQRLAPIISRCLHGLMRTAGGPTMERSLAAALPTLQAVTAKLLPPPPPAPAMTQQQQAAAQAAKADSHTRTHGGGGLSSGGGS